MTLTLFDVDKAAEGKDTPILDFILMAQEDGGTYTVNISADDLNSIYHPDIIATRGKFKQVGQEKVQFYYMNSIFQNIDGEDF